MEGLESDLTNIRFSAPVIELLKNANVTSVERLMESDQLLTEIRTHLKPIQHVKLNALIRQKNHPQDDDEGDFEEVVHRATRKEIITERDFEQQCVDELKRWTDAPESVQNLIVLHQCRVERLSSLLRGKQSKSVAEPTARLRSDPGVLSPTEKRQATLKSEDSPVPADHHGENLKPSHDTFIHEQQRAYERRMSLLFRLTNICKIVSAYNRDVGSALLWRRDWTQKRTALDNNHGCGEARKNLNEEGNRISKQERTLTRHAEAMRRNVLDWNTDAMRLNMYLIENPMLDPSSYLETLVMFKIFGEETIALVTQHSRSKLVQPGEYLESYLRRVEEAQAALK